MWFALSVFMQHVCDILPWYMHLLCLLAG